MMCGINPSHNTPNQQRIRGTLLCPSMSILCTGWWNLQGLRNGQDTYMSGRVWEELLGDLTWINCTYLNQWANAVFLTMVYKVDTPVAAKGSRLCIPMEALQLENQAGRGCSTKQAWNPVAQLNWTQKIFQVWGQGVRWGNLVWMLHKLKTWHIPCCATVIHLPFVWELFCRPDLRQFPVFYSWFEWSHSICHLVASPHSH